MPGRWGLREQTDGAVARRRVLFGRSAGQTRTLVWEMVYDSHPSLPLSLAGDVQECVFLNGIHSGIAGMLASPVVEEVAATMRCQRNPTACGWALDYLSCAQTPPNLACSQNL